MFVGRERELETLSRLYDESNFQMVVIYGRRRIGKTKLISEFVKDKPAIFFTAQEVNDSLNLNELSKKIYRFFDIPESTGPFSNWISVFDFLAVKAKENRFVFAFDEFPYAVTANHSLKSILQTAIDHSFQDSGLFLILCGSHIGFMESEVLGYKSPLFGRRTAQIKLEGFDYFDAAKMLGAFSNEDKLKLYACVGGTPHYISQIKSSETFADNIKRLFFDNSGYLYNEPMMLLQQELREPALYNSIIMAIAGGASRLNEIATRIGEDSPKVSKYLQTLYSMQIVRKVFPFGENMETSRKGIYAIEDNCYRFSFRFVFANKPEIESGNGDIIADTLIGGQELASYIGKPPFETICLQYLRRAGRSGKLPFTATSFGSWWGNDPLSKSQADIDVIAANRVTKQAIIGECKWTSNVTITAALKQLIVKNHLLPEYTDLRYYIFLKAFVQKSIISHEATVITTDDLYDGIE